MFHRAGIFCEIDDILLRFRHGRPPEVKAVTRKPESFRIEE